MIKVIVLIEILYVVFQMDEIIWELCDYIVGLNCGCWDYIFSYIKMMCNYVVFVLFDRVEVMMDQVFLVLYVVWLVKVCYCRGIYVMGGMLVVILVCDDVEVNEVVFVQVCVDKLCEVGMGFDGCWVVYFDLVLVVQVIFDVEMFGLNQICKFWQEWWIELVMLLWLYQGKVM